MKPQTPYRRLIVLPLCRRALAIYVHPDCYSICRRRHPSLPCLAVSFHLVSIVLHVSLLTREDQFRSIWKLSESNVLFGISLLLVAPAFILGCMCGIRAWVIHIMTGLAAIDNIVTGWLITQVMDVLHDQGHSPSSCGNQRQASSELTACSTGSFAALSKRVSSQVFSPSVASSVSSHGQRRSCMACSLSPLGESIQTRYWTRFCPAESCAKRCSATWTP